MADLKLNTTNGSVTLKPEDGSGNVDVTIPRTGVGKILQVVMEKIQISGTTSAGGPNEVSGLEIYSTSFAPLSANSKILVQTSSVLVQEISNVGNSMWLGAWADTYQIGCNSATGHYTNFASSQNMVYHSLNHYIHSWGTTPRMIRVRAGGDGGTLYVNTQGYSDYAAGFREIGITITEIAN